MMKKLLSLIMALAMALTLAVPVMAAEQTGSITIKKGTETAPIAGKTFKAYKILDLTMVGEAGHVYTVPAAMKAFYSERYSIDQAASDFDYQVTEEVRADAGSDIYTFASAVLKAAKTAQITPATASAADGVEAVTFTGLPLGYYVIEDIGTATPISALMLDTTNLNPEIVIKASVPTIEKVDDKVSADVGESVTYTVTSKVPDTIGYTSYTFEITDTMSDGLTFNKDISVKVGGKALDAQYYNIVSQEDDGFVLTINVMALQVNKGEEIELTYSATVNENAVAQIENNSVVLKYSNNPNNNESFDTTPPDKEEVYSAKIIVDKCDANDQTVKLAGAQFVLKKEDNGTTLYYSYDQATEKVVWVDEVSTAKVMTTNESGAAEFIGLADGTYYLEEIVAPAGYNKLQKDVTITINGANGASALTHTEIVTNNSGNELPETGGMGTTLFYALGAVLVIGAGVAMVTKKRMA